MARRRCLGFAECRQFVTPGQSWCEAHRRIRKARRNRDAKLCAEAVARHRAEFGDWCPGYGRDGHPATDLTADHPRGIHTGGDGEIGEVLCRSCNSRKGLT